MRRRILLGNDTEYVFSASTTASVGYYSYSHNHNVISTANGQNIGYTVVSYDGCVTSAYKSGQYLSYYCGDNTTASERIGHITIKQNESNNILTITVTQSALLSLKPDYNAIILDSANNSTGNTAFNVSWGGNVQSKPSWVNAVYSNGRISITATSANNASTIKTGITYVKIGEYEATVTIIQMPSTYSSVDGYQYVTINGTKWAISDIGSTKPYELGTRYQYGKGARPYSVTSGETVYQGTENPLDYSVDAARQVMGGGWRLPTYNDAQKLDYIGSYGNGKYSASYNGVAGCAVCDFNTSQCLFFASSSYRSLGSTPISNSDYFYGVRAYYSYGLGANDVLIGAVWGCYRNNGYYVRGFHD